MEVHCQNTYLQAYFFIGLWPSTSYRWNQGSLIKFFPYPDETND